MLARLVVLLLGGAVAVVMLAQPVAAHPTLVATLPEAGYSVNTPPEEIGLVFDERVTVHELVVEGQARGDIRTTDLQVSTDGTRVVVTPTLAELKATWSRRDDSTTSASQAGINMLADGEPVTAATLAEAIGVSIDQAESYIDDAKRVSVEVEDGAGAVVGAALTLRPTRHRFRVRGNDLYTWCGFDALFLPIILGERAEVASTCPVTGAEIRLTVEADGTVSAANPSPIVVGIVGEEITSCCTVSGPDSEICTQMPFFASGDAGERWVADHPGVAIVSLADAREVARAYVDGCC